MFHLFRWGWGKGGARFVLSRCFRGPLNLKREDVDPEGLTDILESSPATLGL